MSANLLDVREYFENIQKEQYYILSDNLRELLVRVHRQYTVVRTNRLSIYQNWMCMSLYLIILLPILLVKEVLCYLGCLELINVYVFPCYYLLLVQVDMKQNLFGRCIRKWELIAIELHKHSLTLLSLCLQLVCLFLSFALVSNYVMFPLFPVSISINIRN